MVNCSVKWCGKSSKASSYKKDGITFHRFPKPPDVKEKWIDATHRGDSWFPLKSSVICSRHFTADNFHLMNQRRRLMDSAVPTLHLPVLVPNPPNVSTSNIKQELENLDLDAGACASTKTVCDSTLQETNPAIIVEVPSLHDIDLEASTSAKQEFDLTPQDSNLVATSQLQSVDNSHLVTPSRKIKLEPDLPDTPSAYDSPVQKRLCRRIIELNNVVKEKNIKLRKLRDSNRRLKRQIISLKSLLSESENKNINNTRDTFNGRLSGRKTPRNRRKANVEGKMGQKLKK